MGRLPLTAAPSPVLPEAARPAMTVKSLPAASACTLPPALIAYPSPPSISTSDLRLNTFTLTVAPTATPLPVEPEAAMMPLAITLLDLASTFTLSEGVAFSISLRSLVPMAARDSRSVPHMKTMRVTLSLPFPLMVVNFSLAWLDTWVFSFPELDS